MLLATVVSLIGLAAVLVAVYRDRTVVELGPEVPEWDALPAPADLGHPSFPLAVPGYDPATVDIHLDRLRRAYTDLYAAAPPQVRAAASGSAQDVHVAADPLHVEELPAMADVEESRPPSAQERHDERDGEPAVDWEPPSRPGGQERV